MKQEMYTTDRRWYRTADGKIVDATGVAKLSNRAGLKLLAVRGAVIPLADARHYGMVLDGVSGSDEEAATEASAEESEEQSDGESEADADDAESADPTSDTKPGRKKRTPKP